MMKFMFDGNYVDPALNWQEITSTLRRDKDQNLFLLFQEYTLEFDGSGFAYIKAIVDGDTFCEEIVVSILKECDGQEQLIFKGTLFIVDVEINERTCIANCKVNDMSFFSRINNNKNIDTALDADFTKNLAQITAPVVYELDVHRVLNNVLKYTVDCCRVFEAFKYFISFMSDNKVGFASSLFGINGQWEGLCITTGERLRGVTPSIKVGRWEPFSFNDLFNEINKRIPIVLLIDDPYGSPVVRIESIDYLNNANIVYSANDIEEIVSSYDQDKLYAVVRFGSPVDDTFTDFPETINFYGFKQEEFHILGTCNLDQTLDLTCDWITSSNIIQRLVDFGDQGYDNNIFLIDSILTNATSGRTTNTNFIGSNPARFFYNEELNNQNIADRYIEDLSDSLAAFFVETQDGRALAYRATNLACSGTPNYLTPVTTTQFNTTESFDFGNYYDPVLCRYTALETGVYNFKAQIRIQCQAGTLNGKGYYQFWCVHRDSLGNVIQIYQMYDPILNPTNPYITPNPTFPSINNQVMYIGPNTILGVTINGIIAPTSIAMTQGDYIDMQVNYDPATTVYPAAPPYPLGSVLGSNRGTIIGGIDNTYFECTTANNYGGIFVNVDQRNIRVQLHKFTYPMTQTDFDAILANPVGRFTFGMNGQDPRFGWIQELKYNHTTGLADITLQTSKASQYGS